MTLTWVEVRSRLGRFVTEYSDASYEAGEAQQFVRDLLNCYGVSNRNAALYERRAVRASTGRVGRIDAFMPGVVTIEMKSRGALSTSTGRSRVQSQAEDYLLGGSISETEQPGYVIICDFETLVLTDLTPEGGGPPQETVLSVADLPSNAVLLGFLGGFQRRTYTNAEQEAASVDAAKIMANMFTLLTADADADQEARNPEDEDWTVQQAAIVLTRLLFLLYGDDAGLWEPGLFHDFVAATREDGSDLGAQIAWLFEVLDTPPNRRRVEGIVGEFPYVNGEIFRGHAATQVFTPQMREALLRACDFDWASISPAVFGSLFQAIKTRQARRKAGEHYTSEANILKTLEPLLLDGLRERLRKAWNSPTKIEAFLDHLGTLVLMDPACGCGNFLIVAYRELRQIELEARVRLKELRGESEVRTLDATWDLKVSLENFHGFEIAWWPAKIAETAMFLVDHQANLKMNDLLGGAPDRLPIKMSAHIHHVDALDADWDALVPVQEGQEVFAFGNPPFLGHISRTPHQTSQLKAAWGGRDIGRLDFVTAWHARLMQWFTGKQGEFALVSTNSITQGDQVPRLFSAVEEAGWRIKFAHRTFPWRTESASRDRAVVHCTIIGFTRAPVVKSRPDVRLFEYPRGSAEPVESRHAVINGYLVPFPHIRIDPRPRPLAADLEPVVFGNMPRDGGNLTITPNQYDEVVADPVAAKYVHPFVGGEELLHGKKRWCLWMAGEDFDPADLRRSRVLSARVAATAEERRASKAESTRRMAATAHLFGQRNAVYDTAFLAIPAVVSDNRHFYTADLLGREVITSNKLYSSQDAHGFQFAVISSSMFITWQKTIGNRLKSDPSFSNTLVWNTFPLPAVTDKQRTNIIAAGQAVLAARAKNSHRTLADHYTPGAMDPELLRAHGALDRAIDGAFGARRGISTELERQRILFEAFRTATAPSSSESETVPHG